jgi:uncharacterized protein
MLIEYQLPLTSRRADVVLAGVDRRTGADAYEGYCDYIADFVASLRGNDDAVRGVAYLHNAADLDVDDLFELATNERTRLERRPPGS